jgi:hypothetical protein
MLANNELEPSLPILILLVLKKNCNVPAITPALRATTAPASKMFKNGFIQHLVHAGAAGKPPLHLARINAHEFEESSIGFGQWDVEIVVANERLAIDIHLKMPMRPLGMLAAALMSTEVVLAARERPLQILILDGQLTTPSASGF